MYLYKMIYILCYYCHESWKNLYENIIFWLNCYYHFSSFKYWFFKSKAKLNILLGTASDHHSFQYCKKTFTKQSQLNTVTPTYFKTFSSSFCKIYFELPLNVLRKTYYRKRIWHYNHIWYSFFLVSFEVKIFAKTNQTKIFPQVLRNSLQKSLHLLTEKFNLW